ncbi:MAG TPA: 50S ribosome-binding GTPase, partial [Candidatus Dojkabacteria bacterium]|nr:50S ribosome-binding GTPase [Candidatus Dojkabacteria bacterium]
MQKKQQDLSIVVFGRTGTGKSTLINKLAKTRVFDEGDTIFSETLHCATASIKIKDKIVKVIDTPGFGDNRGDVKMTQLLKDIVRMLAQIQGLSICLFCLNGAKGKPDQHDIEELDMMSAIMGQAITEHLVIAMTRMNTLAPDAKKQAYKMYSEELIFWDKFLNQSCLLILTTLNSLKTNFLP